MDLVLTAAHCLELIVDCRDLVVVTDFRYQADGQLAPLSRENLFSCRSLALHQLSPPDSDQQIDVAILQLDRAVPLSHEPATVRPAGPLRAGEPVTTIGCPERLPLKIDSGGQVRDPRAAAGDYFTLTADAFTGSSGSGVFDADHRLMGSLARGGSDYRAQGDCQVARVAPDDSPGESATHVRPAIDSLCASGWPSPQLCGKPAACGDATCSGAESSASCPADCAPPTCGDRLCERPEWPACPADCGDRRHPDTPGTWVCQEEWYADGETCDCRCGAPDPDCGPPSAPRPCDKAGPAGREVSPPGCTCTVTTPTPAPPVLILLALLGVARLARVARRRRPFRR